MSEPRSPDQSRRGWSLRFTAWPQLSDTGRLAAGVAAFAFTGVVAYLAARHRAPGSAALHGATWEERRDAVLVDPAPFQTALAAALEHYGVQTVILIPRSADPSDGPAEDLPLAEQDRLVIHITRHLMSDRDFDEFMTALAAALRSWFEADVDFHVQRRSLRGR